MGEQQADAVLGRAAGGEAPQAFSRAPGYIEAARVADEKKLTEREFEQPVTVEGQFEQLMERQLAEKPYLEKPKQQVMQRTLKKQ